METTNLSFKDMGLSEQMLKALEKKGYGYPTTIQQQAIPEFLQWKDVIAKAPTGTGKTFAFGIPMIEHVDPELAEVQGLVSPTGFGNPRRMATGFDYNRLSLILAVLEKRAGYLFSNLDTYVNVVGGLWLDEPAMDLPVALALISGLKDVTVSSDTVAFGEIGLTGEIRSVSNADLRISEAARMGFKRVIVPYHNLASLAKRDNIEVIGVKTVREAFEEIQNS